MTEKQVGEISLVSLKWQLAKMGGTRKHARLD